MLLARSSPRRLGVALGLLCGEYLMLFMTLAVRHDGPVLEHLPGLWRLLGYSTAAVGGAAMALAALAILRNARALHAEPARITALTVAIHALGYGTCFVLAVFVFGHPDALTPTAANASFCVWLISGAASLGALFVVTFGKLKWENVGRARALVGATVGLSLLAALGAQFAKQFWHELAPLTLQLARQLLELGYSDVFVSPERENVIGVGGFSVLVTDECSGIEGMGLITMFVAGYLVRYRAQLRFPAALCMLPLGLALAFLSNAVRIAALVALGSSVSPEIAKGGFHSNAGGILFCALAVGLVYGCQRWSLVHEQPARPDAVSADADSGTTAAYLLPLVTLLGTGLISSAFTSKQLDPAYALRLCTAGYAFHVYRRYYSKLDWRCSPKALLIGAGVFVIWLLLPPPDAAASSDAMQTELNAFGPWAPLWLALRFTGSSLIVPLAEELAFRGYLQRRLISEHWIGVELGRFAPLSFVITALAFGALHPNWIAGTIAGAAYAAASYTSGRLTDAVAAHATTNFLLCVWALVFGSWAYL